MNAQGRTNPNHTLADSGTGRVIRHNVFLNGQESIYYERNAFDDLTVEHNVLFNGALFWVRNNGAGVVCAHMADMRRLALADRQLVERTFDISRTISSLERHFEPAIAHGSARRARFRRFNGS